MGLWKEIGELTRVRVALFVREPEAVFWVLAFPLILAVVLGFAFRDRGVEPSLIGLVGEGPAAEALAELLEREEHVELERLGAEEEAQERLFRSALDALVVAEEPPRVSFDEQRPESETARLRVLRALGERSQREVALAPVEGTGRRYVDYLVPGLLGMNLMGTGMWAIGFAVADFRQRKLLRRLLVTPMRRSSFLLSFLLSRLVFLAVEVAVVALFATLVLDVPFRGGIAVFAALSVLGAFTFAGLGMLVAARPKTIEGVSGVMNLVMVPMWLCSGIFFSYERFPEVVHPLIRALPLTALNDGLRAVMLDGEGIAALGAEVLVLVAWALGAFLLALKAFRWE